MSSKIGGSGNKSSYTPYTGLASVKVLCVNPTNEEYERITGSAFPSELKYDPIMGEDGKKESQLLNFLVHEPITNTFAFLPVFLSKSNVTTKDGKKSKYIDKLGQISYFIDDINNISSKFRFDIVSATPLKKGQESLTVLLQRLFGYKSNSPGANWAEDMKNCKADIVTLYNNKVSGLNELLKEAYDSDYSVIVLFSVREKDGKYYQSVENNPDLIWSNQGDDIPNYCYKDMKEKQDEQNKAGYPLTKNLYTFKFQKFNLEECANYVPSNDEIGDEPNLSNPGIGGTMFDVSMSSDIEDDKDPFSDPFGAEVENPDEDEWLGN